MNKKQPFSIVIGWNPKNEKAGAMLMTPADNGCFFLKEVLWQPPQPKRNDYSLSSKMFIISQAAFATLVPGPKMAATPAL